MITFAVITCNRFFYFRNCLESILEFVDLNDINILVINNNTTESGFHNYLSSVANRVDVKNYNDRNPNELHRAMNYAIKYSKKKGNKYVNFIQDDYQYVTPVKDLPRLVSDVFNAKKSIVQIHTNFIWKYKSKKIGKFSPFIINGIKFYYWHSKAPCDNGITKISIYDKIGLYPSRISIHGKERGYRSGEAWFAKQCRGLKRALLAKPNMSMIPDCAFIRGKKRIGKYFPPPQKYYLEQLSTSKIKLIEKNSLKNKMCFIEDIVETNGWVVDAKGRKHSNSKIVTKI